MEILPVTRTIVKQCVISKFPVNHVLYLENSGPTFETTKHQPSHWRTNVTKKTHRLPQKSKNISEKRFKKLWTRQLDRPFRQLILRPLLHIPKIKQWHIKLVLHLRYSKPRVQIILPSSAHALYAVLSTGLIIMISIPILCWYVD